MTQKRALAGARARAQGGGRGHGAGHGMGRGMGQGRGRGGGRAWGRGTRSGGRAWGRGIWSGAPPSGAPPEKSRGQVLQSCSRCQGISAAVRTEDSEGVASPGTRGGEKAQLPVRLLAGAPRMSCFPCRRQAPSTVGSPPRVRPLVTPTPQV